MTYDSGAVTAAISGNVTAVPAVQICSSTQTPIHRRITGNGATQSIYTVPNSTGTEKFYLYAIQMQPVAGGSTWYENDGTTLVCEMVSTATSPSLFLAPGFPFAIYTAGQAVKVNAPAGNNVFCYGILVS